MTDIELVRTLAGNTEVSDDFVSFYLQGSESFIKAYCNIDAIPEALHNTYIEIAALKLKANFSGNTAITGEGIKIVNSMTDGNQSIGFAAGTLRQFNVDDDFVASFGSILNKYKRLPVDGSCQRTLGSRCLHTINQHSNKARW